MTARIAVAIPTYNRGAILAETVRRLLELPRRADAILVVDQTPEHPADVAARLRRWDEEGKVRWLRLDRPSIPHAMNEALRVAAAELVLFLDDDVEPAPGLIAAHLDAHANPRVWAVVGQILQPGEEPAHVARPADDLEFRFNHDAPAEITNVMAGNLSVKRERSLSIRGFDENFIGAAYRFETDFALRLVAAGGVIAFEPRASLRHLKLSSGGLRSFGDHRTTTSPLHAVGDYYFALHHRRDFWRYAARRLRRNVLTRFHAARPWFIPTKLVGEMRALILARRLARQGPKLL
jgi:GT2 family glycosyltransferase